MKDDKKEEEVTIKLMPAPGVVMQELDERGYPIGKPVVGKYPGQIKSEQEIREELALCDDEPDNYFDKGYKAALEWVLRNSTGEV